MLRPLDIPILLNIVVHNTKKEERKKHGCFDTQSKNDRQERRDSLRFLPFVLSRQAYPEYYSFTKMLNVVKLDE